MYTYEDYRVFAARLLDAGFDIAQDGFGPNVQRTGSEPAYVAFLSGAYLKADFKAVEGQVLEVLPEFTSAKARVKQYHWEGKVVTELWVYLN
jgi:hypothetical protein